MKIKAMRFVTYLHCPCPALADVFNFIGEEPNKMCNFKLLKPNPGKAWGENKAIICLLRSHVFVSFGTSII